MDLERLLLERRVMEELENRVLRKPTYPAVLEFAAWVVENFRPVLCPQKLMRVTGRMVLCKRPQWHEGPCEFDSSIRESGEG